MRMSYEMSAASATDWRKNRGAPSKSGGTPKSNIGVPKGCGERRRRPPSARPLKSRLGGSD